MKHPLFRICLLLSLLGMSLGGCNMPNPPTGSATSTPIIAFPTPTATSGESAAAAATKAAAWSATPASVQPSATTVPASATPLPPTDTPVPLTATKRPPTVTSTRTPAPTGTATAIPRPSASAVHFAKAPVIDGVWDEWTSTQYPIKNVVWGRSNWTGSADLQASYRVGWDAKYLYVAVKVYDDTYAQNASGADLYKGDSIELLLSTKPDADSPALGLTANDYQIGVSPGRPTLGKNMEAYRWFPQNKAALLTKAVIGAVAMDGGYRIEFAIPWSTFSLAPYSGMVLGFTVSVNDDDNTAKNVQQTLISSSPRRALTDPTTWGLLILK